MLVSDTDGPHTGTRFHCMGENNEATNATIRDATGNSHRPYALTSAPTDAYQARSGMEKKADT